MATPDAGIRIAARTGRNIGASPLWPVRTTTAGHAPAAQWIFVEEVTARTTDRLISLFRSGLPRSDTAGDQGESGHVLRRAVDRRVDADHTSMLVHVLLDHLSVIPRRPRRG